MYFLKYNLEGKQLKSISLENRENLTSYNGTGQYLLIHMVFHFFINFIVRLVFESLIDVNACIVIILLLIMTDSKIVMGLSI